jgi:hypothetical protein
MRRWWRRAVVYRLCRILTTARPVRIVSSRHVGSFLDEVQPESRREQHRSHRAGGVSSTCDPYDAAVLAHDVKDQRSYFGAMVPS